MIAALLLALALAMDAFAVALTQGARFRPGAGGALTIGATFGMFQGVMPLIGWGIGAVALAYVAAVDHWIAFALLAFLGARMVLGGGDGDAPRLTGKALLVAGVATSIDALAAGITLPALGVPPLAACALIGVVTFALSAAGVLLGRAAGDRYGRAAEIFGGLILIALGCRILYQHTLGA
jgi:manganese efflux pump family protein